MADTFDLKGLDATIARMKTLPNDVRKKLVVPSMRKATRVVTNAAKANALRIDDPTTARKIAANIQQRFASRTYARTGDVMFRVGVANPKGKIPKGNPDEGEGSPTRHWHLLELGTEAMAARPFMLPALADNIEAATSAFAAEAAKRIAKL